MGTGNIHANSWSVTHIFELAAIWGDSAFLNRQVEKSNKIYKNEII